MWFWILVILLLIAIFGWPSWPYTANRGWYARGGSWGYGVSGIAILIIIIVLILSWTGALAIGWPWVAPAAPPAAPAA